MSAELDDRRLLEQAAKAAGLQIVGPVETYIAQPSFEHIGGFFVRNDRGGDSVWNPLRDDGDALRLAVELRFDLNFQRTGRERIVQVYSSRIGKWVSETYRDNDDSCAVMRKVIVLAAASIGKTGEPT